MFSIKYIKLNNSNVSIISLFILAICIFANYFDGYFQTVITPLKIGIAMIFAIILTTRVSVLRLPDNWLIFSLFVMFISPSFFLTDGFIPVFISFIGYIVLMFVIANMDMSHQKMLTLARAFYVGGMCLSCLCVLDLLASGNLSQFLGVNLVENWYGDYVFLGFEENPNGLASHLLPIVIISYALFIHNQNKWQRYMHLAACLLACYALIMTHSRSAFLASAAGILVILFFYLKIKQGERLRAVFSASVLVSVFSLSLFQIDLFDNTISFAKTIIAHQEMSIELASQNDVEVKGNSVQNNKQNSIDIRLLTLPIFLNIAWENIALGVGFGQSRDLVGRATGHFVGPHNIFLGVLVEYGLAAFCAFLALILWPLMRGFSYIEKRLGEDDVPLAPIIIYSCFVSLLIHGMFHMIYINFTLWLFVAILMALCSGQVKHNGLFSHEI